MSQIYAAWESDAVIAHELARNLGLALACITLITLLMLADLRLCIFVLTTVVLTFFDVMVWTMLDKVMLVVNYRVTKEIRDYFLLTLFSYFINLAQFQAT